MPESHRIRAALGLHLPDIFRAGARHIRRIVRHPFTRQHRVGRARPTAFRFDYPNEIEPLPPIPGGEGLAAALIALDSIVVRVHNASRNWAVQGAHIIESIAKVNAATGFHPPRPTGHIPGTGPGPNVATGELRRSITVGDPREIGDGWDVEVGPAIVYGRAIELGMYRPPRGYHATFELSGGHSYRLTARHSSVEQRHPGFGGIYPYLRPAADQFAAEAEELFTAEIAEALSG